MFRRRLQISANLWASMLTRDTPQMVRIIANRLPDDARCVGIEPDPCHPLTLRLVIESATFGPFDCPDLPEPVFEVCRPSGVLDPFKAFVAQTSDASYWLDDPRTADQARRTRKVQQGELLLRSNGPMPWPPHSLIGCEVIVTVVSYPANNQRVFGPSPLQPQEGGVLARPEHIAAVRRALDTYWVRHKPDPDKRIEEGALRPLEEVQADLRAAGALPAEPDPEPRPIRFREFL